MLYSCSESERSIGPHRSIAQIDSLKTFQKFDQLGVSLREIVVVANDGAILGHQFAEFTPDTKRVLIAFGLHQSRINFFLPFALGIKVAIARSCGLIPGITECIRSGRESSEDARDQRIRAETVGAVILVLALARRENSGNVCRLVEIDPQAAHGVM